MLEAVTLESSDLPVDVENETPTTGGQLRERDLTPQTLAGRPSATQRAAGTDLARVRVPDQVGVLAGLLYR
jgi:hypothetical protein